MTGAAAFVPVEGLRTERLRLDPLRVGDAEEMVGVLSAPELYTVIGGEPPDVEALRRQYAAQVAGPPEGEEQWLNWVLRRHDGGEAVGYVQATVGPGAGDGIEAEIAWVVGLPWQRHGYASEAAVALVAWLTDCGVARVMAHVAPGHRPSERVAARAGLVATEVLHDGEVRWERELGGAAICSH